VRGDRREARECTKVRTLSVVIKALEFEPVGPQNQWVDAMFLTPNKGIGCVNVIWTGNE
jgi:hypothetical protein